MFKELARSGEDATVAAHPSCPEDGPMTYKDMLKACREQQVWGFVRIPADPLVLAEFHTWWHKDAPLELVMHMLAHEAGHLSGTPLKDDAAEEERADGYAEVVLEVIRMLGRFQ